MQEPFGRTRFFITINKEDDGRILVTRFYPNHEKDGIRVLGKCEAGKLEEFLKEYDLNEEPAWHYQGKHSFISQLLYSESGR